MVDSNNCVDEEQFYREVEQLKSQLKTKDSKITCYLENEFYDKAKNFLREKTQKQLGLTNDHRSEPCGTLTKWEEQTVTRKKWIFNNNKLFTQDNKTVVPKRDLFQVLCQAHSRILHRGRQITFKWVLDNYAEVNQKVVNIFIKMCRFHAEQRSLTSRVKIVDKPLQAPTFLSLIEIDLMDLRKCPCDCGETHTWIMNVTDHHTKHVTLYALPAKSAEKVLSSLQHYCHSYGYPKSILCDNGREFRNQIMVTFCQNNNITMKHGAPRTPTTQGLIERSNRSCKEDLHTLIVSTTRNNSKWCSCLSNISYTRNITFHTAINTTPYEAVFGIKPHREISQDKNTDTHSEDCSQEPEQLNTNQDLHVEHHEQTLNDERQTKQQKICDSQAQYNEKMIKQSNKKAKKKSSDFKIDDVVSIKIDKVDKTAPFHPNMLLGKITEIENSYARVVTKFGRIHSLISPTRLMKCTATNLKFDYSKEISFTMACKQANDQNN